MEVLENTSLRELRVIAASLYIEDECVKALGKLNVKNTWITAIKEAERYLDDINDPFLFSLPSYLPKINACNGSGVIALYGTLREPCMNDWGSGSLFTTTCYQCGTSRQPCMNEWQASQKYVIGSQLEETAIGYVQYRFNHDCGGAIFIINGVRGEIKLNNGEVINSTWKFKVFERNIHCIRPQNKS